MVVALISGYVLRTVLRRMVSRADDGGGFCCRRVAAIAVNGIGPLLTSAWASA
jgi:hypothetical protein